MAEGTQVEKRLSDVKRAAHEQDRAPIYEALIDYQQRQTMPLHTPGHKGTLGPAGQEEFLTSLGLACDLPSMEFTDNTFHPRGCVAQAQRLAAELWGASDTFFLVNGSTIGIQAMVLAAVSPGETILLSRHVHLSTLSALVLSGATPVYLPPQWLDAAGPVPPRIEELDLYLTLHPQTRAVLLTNPTYYGVGRNLEAFARLCHQRGIPLLIDEAHGAHLHFMTGTGLPSAVASGADVVVQSVHKTLVSLVGTAQLHRCQESLVSRERLQAMLNLLQSTSSNYLLLASLDLTRRWMYRSGASLFQNACEQVISLRNRLNAIPGIRVLDVEDYSELAGCEIDPLRLVVDVSGLGKTGFQIERQLEEEFHILDEFCDSRNVIFILGPADPPDAYDRLERALSTLSGRASAKPIKDNHLASSAPLPPVAITPREAAFRKKKREPLRSALGRICGEVITMYPPGIPVACPGEELTAEVLDYCEYLASQNICVFAEDASLSTVSVLED